MKKYILFPLLVTFLLTGCQTEPSVQDINDATVQTETNIQVEIVEPYDYMSALNGRDYDTLSTPEKKLVYSIPEDIAKGLTTEALLETILNNKYLVDLYAFDNIVAAIQSREEQFRIVELLGREDVDVVLETYLENYRMKLSDKEKELGITLNEVESRLIQGAELSEGEKELLDIFETIYTIEDFIILKPELIQ